MIEVVDLVKKYDNYKAAVNGVSFSIQQGEIVGLLGPNGAGKTTIMKILTAYHYPSHGSVTIAGIPLFGNPQGIKELLGYLPENAPVYPELTVQEYLEFMAGVRIGKGKSPSGLDANQAVTKAVKDCGLEDVFYKSIDTLSKGYRQRVGLAQAILHDPKILILDEPTTGLDPHQILEIRKLIKELGKSRTIILSTHILSEVEAVCDRVLILNEGKIVAQGKIDEIGQELRGSPVCRVSIKGDGKPFVGQLAKEHPGIKTRDQLQAGDTVVSLDIIGKPGMAILALQELLFRTAVSSGVTLVQLLPVQESLENIFITLTKSGDKNE